MTELTNLKNKYKEAFGADAAFNLRVPGRTELCGNHTDHQHGIVLAAAVNLYISAAFSARDDKLANIISEGFGQISVDLRNLDACPEEKGKSAALVRGIAAGFEKMGKPVSGFNAYITSDIPSGSGLSSSAAFEILIGRIFNELGSCGLSPLELAQIGQQAENVYFGKPCGLMDQIACAYGGIVAIDFQDIENPVVEPLDFDFEEQGYSLCIINTGSDHADLTDEYSAITEDLKKISSYFGKEYLREVPEISFRTEMKALRDSFGDRAVLRAMHVYAENRRVDDIVTVIEKKDMDGYLKLVRASGDSSYKLMQNIIPAGSTDHQPLSFALGVAGQLLGSFGVCRVHGGGFAGAIQAYVPTMLIMEFTRSMDTYFGEGSCTVLSVVKQTEIQKE